MGSLQRELLPPRKLGSNAETSSLPEERRGEERRGEERRGEERRGEERRGEERRGNHDPVVKTTKV
ncbi:hypothetical protein D4764_01G0014250 [Takifugu flavidus]|uniref:Uncharacterized protein n=1 Tax=Takifugu flavidus TaxID=433684 RepID=A0A5C6PTB9_9TELE|nr:hypothetical protein D4764_01G0014250 [Takifugu flavidus]